MIPLAPKGQMRARHSAMKSKTGRVFSRTYKSGKQESTEQRIMFYLQYSVPKQPIKTAVSVGVRCYMPIPKSKPKKWKEEARQGLIRPTTKPDLDNLCKNILECLTMMRFIHDDRQVVEFLPGTGKYYSDNPRWELELIW